MKIAITGKMCSGKSTVANLIYTIDPRYKKYSFDIVKKNKDINFEILEKASLIRSEWPNFVKHPFVGNKIPEWVEKELKSNYFERTLNLCSSFINHSPLKNKSIKI